MNEKGFTLIEVILVIAIMGIISTIAVPSFKKYQLNARVVAHNATVNTLKSAGTLYFIDNPEKGETGEDFKDYLDKDDNLNIDKFIISKLSLKEKIFTVKYEKNNVIINPGILSLENGEMILIVDENAGQRND